MAGSYVRSMRATLSPRRALPNTHALIMCSSKTTTRLSVSVITSLVGCDLQDFETSYNWVVWHVAVMVIIAVCPHGTCNESIVVKE